MRGLIYAMRLTAGLVIGLVGMIAEDVGKAVQDIGRKVI
jgi:hypothetical protein